MMRAEPRLGRGSSRAWTMAQAIGIMMAVRTVIEGMPKARMTPMTRKAKTMPL